MIRPVDTIQVGTLNLFDRSLKAIPVAVTARQVLKEALVIDQGLLKLGLWKRSVPIKRS